jgi:hypothetical protein
VHANFFSCHKLSPSSLARLAIMVAIWDLTG